MVRCGFWTEMGGGGRYHSQIEMRSWGYSVLLFRKNWGRGEIFFFFTPHLYWKAQDKATRCLLPFVQTFGLWLMVPGEPRCPQQERHASDCVNCALFAVSFKANYLLTSFSPPSQVSLGKHSRYEDLEFILWKCKSHCPASCDNLGQRPLSGIKLLVWRR